MSANNKLIVNRKTFEVVMLDMDGGGGYVEYVGKNFDDALKKALEIQENEIVEYGVSVIN